MGKFSARHLSLKRGHFVPHRNLTKLKADDVVEVHVFMKKGQLLAE
jgi:hypothetical protein